MKFQHLSFPSIVFDCRSLVSLLGVPVINVASHLTSDLFNPDCWDSDDSPPPLPARTPESFILATGAFALVKIHRCVFQRCGFTGSPPGYISGLFFVFLAGQDGGRIRG